MRIKISKHLKIQLPKCLSNLFEKKIDKKIGLEEVIVRTLFSDLVKKDNGVRTNAFKSYPRDTDTVSVTRLSLTNILFVKKFSLSIKKPNYCGVASIYAKNIFGYGATIVYSPTETNKYHADVKIGYEVKKGETLPSELSEKIKNIADKAKLHRDNCPENSKNWCGDKEIIPNP